MSGGGRSLQDIYDAGSKRLDELEQNQKGQLDETGSKAVEQLGQIESSVMQRMERSWQDLDNEVRSYLDKALEGIKAAVDTEVGENRRFLERLEETMKLSATRLNQDVQHLKESLQSRINSSTENNLLLQKRQQDQSLGALKVDGALYTVQLNERSQESVRQFESENADLITSLLDKNINLPSEFFQEYSKSLSELDLKLKECLDSLTNRGRQIRSEISNDTTEIQASLDTSLQHIQELLEQGFQQSDAVLRSQCEQSLAQAIEHQESLANNLASELKDSPQLSTSGIQEQLSSLKNDTDRLLDQVKQLIADVDFGVRTNAAQLTEDFEQSLQDRMENAREQHKVVAEERTQLMERIAGDLREIETGFQNRLTELAQNCLKRLSTVCVDAEMTIVAAHDSCAAEFKNLSAAQERSIEERANAMLAEIESLSVRAIQEIKAAAGDVTDVGSASPSGGSSMMSGDNPFGELRL